MWAFQYKHGDKPLEGFTIQRAAGRGGFGEVYYAISDSGREVALKAVTGYEQIELRGISQCMNLKNPHLVSIFDVKYNDQNRPFVIMEFVAGPSLRQLLDESPGGLGAQKTAFFLREIGKGLTFLHDCGIVHRDLKPGNIFYENGYVKIGDYGLSKAMEPTQHSGQTITVGTVHYMAPEIGGGRYDKSIDIYAMGAVLYEMLTGQPPFLGASAGEILMKHVSSEPDLSNIEEPFKAVIRKAMAKNPADRYQSVQEMVEAVFGAEHIQQSVSCFSPDSLSMIAQRVGQRVAVGGGSATPPPIPRGRGGAAVATAPAAPGERLGRMFDRVGDGLGAIGNRMADLGVHALPNRARRQAGDDPDEQVETGDPLCDPLSRRQRRMLGLMMLLLVSAAAAVISPVGGHDGGILSFWGAFLSTIGASLGLLLAGHRILPQMASDSGFLRRLASGGTAAALIMLFGMVVFGSGHGNQQEELGMTAIGALIALLLTNPPDLSPSRLERVAFGPAFGAAALGFVAWIFTQGNFGLLVAILAGSNLLAQVLSPWDPFAARRRAGLSGDSSGAAAVPMNPAPATPAAAAGYDWNWERAAGQPVHGGDAPTMAWPPAAPGATGAPAAQVATTSPMPAGYRPVPAGAWFLWLAGLVAMIPAGVALLFAGNNMPGGSMEFATMNAFGAGALLLGVLCLVKLCQGRMRGWWGYAFKPLLLWACAQTIVFSSILMANAHLSHEGEVASLFFIVMPAVLMLVLLFVRGRPASAIAASMPTGATGADAPPAATALPPLPPLPPLPGHPAARRAERMRRRAQWHEAQAWRVKGPPFHVRVFNFVKGLVVGTSLTTLLLIATAAWLFIAMNIPGMLAAGIPDKDIPRDLTEGFGFSHWPQLMLTVGYVAGWAALLLAGAVLVIARRSTYGLHIVRGLVGVAVFAASLLFLDRALHRDWKVVVASGADDAITSAAITSGGVSVHSPDLDLDVGPEGVHASRPARRPHDPDAERVAQAFERYLGSASTSAIPVAGGVALVGLVLMCWPARKRDASDDVLPPVGGPVRGPEMPPAAQNA